MPSRMGIIQWLRYSLERSEFTKRTQERNKSSVDSRAQCPIRACSAPNSKQAQLHGRSLAKHGYARFIKTESDCGVTERLRNRSLPKPKESTTLAWHGLSPRRWKASLRSRVTKRKASSKSSAKWTEVRLETWGRRPASEQKPLGHHSRLSRVAEGKAGVQRISGRKCGEYGRRSGLAPPYQFRRWPASPCRGLRYAPLPLPQHGALRVDGVRWLAVRDVQLFRVFPLRDV